MHTLQCCTKNCIKLLQPHAGACWPILYCPFQSINPPTEWNFLIRIEMSLLAFSYHLAMRPPVLTEAVCCWDGDGRWGGEVKSASSDWAASSWRIAIRGEDWEEKCQAIRLKYTTTMRTNTSPPGNTLTLRGFVLELTPTTYMFQIHWLDFFFNYTQLQYQTILSNLCPTEAWPIQSHAACLTPPAI